MADPVLAQPRLVERELAGVNRAPYNPRVALEPGMPEFDRLQKSIEEWGLVDPLVLNEATNTLVGGHQRMTVLEHAGYKTGWFILIDEPDVAREKALNIALNRNLGRWDYPALNELLESLEPDLREAAGFDREGEEAAEMLRGAEVSGSSSFLDDFLQGQSGAATDDDPLGGKPREIDHKAEHKDRAGPQLFEIPLVLNDEQRQIYYRAIGRAKQRFGTDNTYEALVAIMDEFNKRLDQEGADAAE